MDAVLLKKYLASYNIKIGKYNILLKCMDKNNSKDNPLLNEIKHLEIELEIIKSCFGILNAGEKSVIEFHIIRQFNWKQTALLYEEHWGKSNVKSERTLKRMQENALCKMVDFINNSDIEKYILNDDCQ